MGIGEIVQHPVFIGDVVQINFLAVQLPEAVTIGIDDARVI